MKKQKMALIGFILPALPVFSYVSLVLISFANNKLGSIIAVDKLILLTFVSTPVIAVLGAVISIIALFKSKTKMTPLAAIVLNIAVLLIVLVCLNTIFSAEFKLIT